MGRHHLCKIEVDTLMALMGLNPMGSVGCVSNYGLSLSSNQALLCLLD